MSGSTPTSSGASVVLTTKGDIVGYDTARKRIGVGTNDQVLTADSTNANGLAWKDTSGGVETTSITTETTFSPSTQNGIIRLSIDPSDLTGGYIDVKIDGTVKNTITNQSPLTRVYNPSSSLDIVTYTQTDLLAESVYDNKSLDYSSKDSWGRGIFFKPDGTKLFVVGRQNRSGYQYNLSTAWDLSTASYSATKNFLQPQNSPNKMYISPDGTHLYVSDDSFRGVYEWSMSAWSLGSASYTNRSYVTSQDTNLSGLHFNSTGTKMFVLGGTNDIIFQYNLSTAWNISTSSYASISYSVSSETSNAMGLHFKSDGTKMYIGDSSTSTIYQYSLSTAWDLSTASYDSISFTPTQPANCYGLYYTGEKLYIGDSTADVYQYTSASVYSGNTNIVIG